MYVQADLALGSPQNLRLLANSRIRAKKQLHTHTHTHGNRLLLRRMLFILTNSAPSVM